MDRKQKSLLSCIFVFGAEIFIFSSNSLVMLLSEMFIGIDVVNNKRFGLVDVGQRGFEEKD